MSAPLPTALDRRRRRRLRLIPVIGYSIVALGLAWFLELRLPTTVILVRHAETDSTMAEGGDPPLNVRGRARAEHLADFLQDIDVVAGVDAIYASDARRTQETARPLADRLGLPVNVEDPYRTGRFTRRLLREHRGEIVLIVTHSDAIAPLIDELHGSKRLPPPQPDVYDDLYIVTIPWWGGVKTLRLHYGGPPPPVSVSGGVEPTGTQ